jgi:hypothetical protein
LAHDSVTGAEPNRSDAMKRLKLWHFRYDDPIRKRKVTTRYAMTEDEAAVRYPDGAEKVGTPVHRLVPEADAERAAASTSGWQRRGSNGSPPG